jgi:hypothetical protein
MNRMKIAIGIGLVAAVALIAQISTTFSAGVGTTNMLDPTGGIIAQWTATTSAVNFLKLVNAATGNGPAIQAAGSDTNINLLLTPKGTTGLVIAGGAGPTDGYYFVPPQNCNFALTTGTLAANSPTTSGGASQPQMVRAAASNPVMQLTTTAAANTTEVTCDVTPPSRLTAGKGVTITAIDYLFGFQTTAWRCGCRYGIDHGWRNPHCYRRDQPFLAGFDYHGWPVL